MLPVRGREIGFNVYSPAPIACLKAAQATAITLRRCAMIVLFDMASGKEYQGDALSTRKESADKTQLPQTAGDDKHPQLQLATLDPTLSEEQSTSIVSGIAIESLLRSIED
jgi:hypothetical protein